MPVFLSISPTQTFKKIFKNETKKKKKLKITIILLIKPVNIM